MSIVLALADAGVTLWNQLRKAEEDAELGREGEDIADLPGVPNQELASSRSRSTQALTQVSQLLGEVLSDDGLRGELSPEEQARLKEISRWLAYEPSQEGVEKAVSDEDMRLSVKAVISIDNYILLIKDAYSDWWDLPGGHVQEGETLTAALQREVFEETGIDVQDMEEMFVMVMKLGEVKPVVFYSVTPVLPINGKLSEEHTAYQWVDLDDTNHYNLGEFHKVFTSGGHLIPGGHDTSVMRPAMEQGQSGVVSNMKDPDTKKAVGYGDDLTNPSFEASLDPGVDPQQAAVSAIQWHHGDPVEVEALRADGDAIVSCPTHDKRWYVTREGEVFSHGLG